MAKFILHDYQTKFINDKAFIVLVRKSRRIGISWAAAYKAVHHAFKHKSLVYYMSSSRNNCKQFIRDCIEHGENIEENFPTLGPVFESRYGKQTYSVKLANGAIIEAMSCSAENFRGKGKHNELFIIDEAAFVENLDDVITAVKPLRILRSQVLFISTEMGDQNPFHLLYQDITSGKQKRASAHTITFDDALKDKKIGFFERVCRETGEKYTPAKEREFRQETIEDIGDFDAPSELFCVPLQGVDGNFLQWEYIDEALCDEGFLYNEWSDISAGLEETKDIRVKCFGETFIGFDIGRKRDDFVLNVVEKLADKVFVRETVVLDPRKIGMPITAKMVIPILRDLIDHYNPSRIIGDATGQGEAYCDQFEDEFGRWLFTRVVFTLQNKIAYGVKLRDLFVNKKIKVPKKDYVVNDLRTVKAEKTPNGTRILHGSIKNHNDFFVALMLAVSEISDYKNYISSVNTKTNILRHADEFRGFLGQ